MYMCILFCERQAMTTRIDLLEKSLQTECSSRQEETKAAFKCYLTVKLQV